MTPGLSKLAPGRPSWAPVGGGPLVHFGLFFFKKTAAFWVFDILMHGVLFDLFFCFKRFVYHVCFCCLKLCGLFFVRVFFVKGRCKIWFNMV